MAINRPVQLNEEAVPNGGFDGETSLTDYFRDADLASDSILAWQIEQKSLQITALRGLFHGPSGLVQLRIWMFLTLAGQSEASLAREEIDQLFHMIRPDAVETVTKRFREVGLLAWDDTQRRYGITTLAQQVASVLTPLSSQSDDELAGLLGQVVGADRLGTLDGNQVQMLQAQLGRLHHEFADAIASGSEFRLREARKRYDRAARLIDRASDAISTIISNARGQAAMEQAARALGQAQARLLAMASQFNRALQQVDRQRVTLGTTGITSTDVKLWLQTWPLLAELAHQAIETPVSLAALALHEMLDVTEVEFERDRPQSREPETLPAAQQAPEGTLDAVALPQELADLSALLRAWGLAVGAGELRDTSSRSMAEALLHESCSPIRYAQVAYKAQLMPLLGDPQAQAMPGATGDLARQPWRAQWTCELQAIDHPAVSQLSVGHLLHATFSTPTKVQNDE